MAVFAEMAKLVNDDVVNALGGGLHEVRIEQKPPFEGAATPALRHLPEGKAARLDPVNADKLQTVCKPPGDAGAGALIEPVFKELTCMGYGRRMTDMNLDAQFPKDDALLICAYDPQTELASQITNGFAAPVTGRGGLRQIGRETVSLGDNPPGTFQHPFANGFDVGMRWGGNADPEIRIDGDR